MKYYKGYRYVLAEDLIRDTPITGYEITDKLTSLTKDGVLTVQKWYAWDGNSGPCLDFKKSLEASCIHDVLCDYINLEWLPDHLQPVVDQEYYNIAVYKRMWEWIVRIRLIAIRWYMTGKGAKRYSRKIYQA